MSDSTSRVLSALVVSVALVVAAIILAQPRYQGFSVEDPGGQSVHGIFDTRAGPVCYAVIVLGSEEVEEGSASEFLRCAPEME